MDLNAATAAAATRGKDLRDSVKGRAGSVGNALALAVLVIGGLIVWWTWPVTPRQATQTSVATPAVNPPQTVYARNGLTIPVGLEWGAPVTFLGRMCAYWDSPANGVEWETSTDGKTWTLGLVDFYIHVRFRAPVATTVTFTLQDPPPLGETCKRRY